MKYLMILLPLAALTVGLTLPGAPDAPARKAEAMSSTTTEHKHTNHLAGENSPYLLSHAHNPVDWYPWGDEALDKAKRENKPIFLSIGYAACHWCHVMERESFENEAIAAVLNEHFVSIKVDREQRPDLDHIYMAFTTAMTGHGGWPMSVFMTPELKPFYAGTYFPPIDAYGRPGFMSLITEIARVYREDNDNLRRSSESIYSRLAAQINVSTAQSLLTGDMISRGASGLMRGFDHVNGGFGSAPKFPHATELSLFLRQFRRTGDHQYLTAAVTGLKAMANGGIYDHLGGGFSRYSTDARWLVPHFEKMLYDNALLVPVYAEAFQITGDNSYLNTIRGTLDFVLREMTDTTGGFYSALDADSEGEEGKFYVWSKSEVDRILGQDSPAFCAYYNITPGGNFEGHNILNVTAESDRALAAAGVTDGPEFLKRCRDRLFAERAKRIRPLTDDKILTSWNGLMVAALCKGYQVTGEQKYLDAAIANATFVRTELFRDNHLTHSYREGGHSHGQFLEDYGYYLHGLLELYQSDHNNNSRWLEFAALLADRADELFMDDDGALYLRDGDQGDLIFRPRDENDGALPAPGSLLVGALLKLGRLSGNEVYTANGENGLRALSGFLESRPGSLASALLALDYHLSDKVEVVIVGTGEVRHQMLAELNTRYLPNAVLAVSPSGDEPWPLFEGRRANNGEVRAFVCRNSACMLPVSTVAEFDSQLTTLDK
ncbi:MAG: thioredoxin domain-containing protein [candidate division Zixibacteria bacterium]|nr:thioredoxin domain-containing protein [candidate division Zixibacteria bacterium]